MDTRIKDQLFIVGGAGAGFGRAVAEALTGHWRGSTLLGVDGLNHRGVLKDTAVIAQAIDFIANC